MRSTRLRTALSIPAGGRKLVVTGTEQVADDEFLLSLLHEQDIWSTVALATSDESEAKKRLLTRSSRYSGLLNVIDILAATTDDEAQLKSLLSNCSAWLAFNVTEESVARLSSAAIDAGVKRAVFTLELPPEHINRTHIPAFDSAKEAFKAAGGAFTGIRHGTVVPGSEDFAYQIVNGTEACVAGTVRRGVLARVVAEMFRGNATHHAVCGLSSSGQLASAYLDVLRGAGLSRQEEVEKIFEGGVQKTMKHIERIVQDTDLENSEESEDADVGEEGMSKPTEREEDRMTRLSAFVVPKLFLPPVVSVFDNYEEEDEEEQSDLDRDRARALQQHILQHAFAHRDASWNVSREDFGEVNRDSALQLAMREVWSWRELKRRAELKDLARKVASTPSIAEEELLQFARLLSLRHTSRISRSPKLMAETLVRYIYLLLEHTTSLCRREGVSFEALRPHEQTLLLRCQANDLRARCGQPSSDLLCDPEDAEQVVRKLTRDAELSAHFGLQNSSTAEVVSRMRTKYSTLLHSVPTLENIAHLLKSSIGILRQKLALESDTMSQALKAQKTTSAFSTR